MTPLLATALILAAAIWLLGFNIVFAIVVVIFKITIALMASVSFIGVLWIAGEGR